MGSCESLVLLCDDWVRSFEKTQDDKWVRFFDPDKYRDKETQDDILE